MTGTTTDPGVKLFRRLKQNWSKLNIDMDSLSKFDYGTNDDFLKDQAESVLKWGLNMIKHNVFPRDDYKELVQLVVVWLGGPVKTFSFRVPGADHHARWMSKAIYFMKLELLSNQFQMTEKESASVTKMAEFVGLFFNG